MWRARARARADACHGQHGGALPIGTGHRRPEGVDDRPAGRGDRLCPQAGGVEPPTSTETVPAVVRGIRRSIGTAPARKSPATADVVTQMLALCPATLRGRRDAALLALGFAGAFRRSELVAMTVANLVDAPDGYRVMIRRSKTDQEGAGQEIAIPRGCRIEPVKLVQAWLQAAGITEGPVFRPVLKGSRVLEEPLSGHSAAAIVKRYALAAGLDPSAFAAHSLRAGFLTSAAESGASVLKMVEVSRSRAVCNASRCLNLLIMRSA